MNRAALEERYTSAGATLVDHVGTRTPRDFGNFAAEYVAIRQGATLLDMGWYNMLRVSGSERVDFLQNMLSNDVESLSEGDGTHSAALSFRGQMLADMVVLYERDSLLLVVDGGRGQNLLRHLNRYLVADDAQIDDISADTGMIALAGPSAESILEAMNWPRPKELWQHACADDQIRIIRLRLTRHFGWGIIAERGELPSIWDRAESAGATPAGLDALNAARVEDGLPWHGVDATDANFPMEVGLEETISRDKGCYLGQETIARILHQGHVSKKLVGVLIEGDRVPDCPSDILRDGKVVGTLTSAVRSPALGQIAGLAVVHTQVSQVGEPLPIVSARGPVAGLVAQLPLVSDPTL